MNLRNKFRHLELRNLSILFIHYFGVKKMELLLPLKNHNMKEQTYNDTILLIWGKYVICLKQYMKIKITLLKLLNRRALAGVAQ